MSEPTTDVTCRMCGATFQSRHTFRTMTRPNGGTVPTAALGRLLCPACRKVTGRAGGSRVKLTDLQLDWSELEHLQ